MIEDKVQIGLDKLADIEMTAEMQVIFESALTVIDKGMNNLKHSERFVLGARLATTIVAGTLGNGLQNQRHLLSPAIEALAEDFTDAAEQIFAAIDDKPALAIF